MKRNILKKLLAWRADAQRKPLLLYGARQVGKTYALNAFAKVAYRDHVYYERLNIRRHRSHQ